jgi:hypothetical protein
MSSKVLSFIQVIRDSFKGSDIVYTQGSCYKFYKILKHVFQEAKAYYNADHVITEIDGMFYDISGIVSITNHIPVDEHFSHEKLDKLIFDMEETKKKRIPRRMKKRNKKWMIRMVRKVYRYHESNTGIRYSEIDYQKAIEGQGLQLFIPKLNENNRD